MYQGEGLQDRTEWWSQGWDPRGLLENGGSSRGPIPVAVCVAGLEILMDGSAWHPGGHTPAVVGVLEVLGSSGLLQSS
jgi:hypothetical protein